MTIETPWGYSVETLPPMLHIEQFRAIYPDFSADDEAVEGALDATSCAIRDYCGWHVSPQLECTFTGEGDGRMLILPAMGVTSVDSLSVNGESVECEWKSCGLVRLKRGYFPDSWRSVVCEYTAGFDAVSVSQVVAQIAANAIAAAPGVANERAGNVSITYNQTGQGITGGVSLLPRDYALLAPYKLARAW